VNLNEFKELLERHPMSIKCSSLNLNPDMSHATTTPDEAFHLFYLKDTPFFFILLGGTNAIRIFIPTLNIALLVKEKEKQGQ